MYGLDSQVKKSTILQRQRSGSIGNLGVDSIDMDMVCDLINEQEEENYEDMISNNLVQFEYDIYE